MANLSLQVRAPLRLTLSDDSVVEITEWSLDGVHYPKELDVFPKEAMLTIPFQGVMITFPVSFAAKPTGRFLAFEGLSGRERETLAIFYRSLLSGRMASTEDVITSLDTPVDLVPMGETEEEKVEGSVGTPPRAFRAALNVGIYLVLGALVFWTLGASAYGKLSGVDIQNARIEATMVEHAAPNAAYVKKILVTPGDRVRRGDMLVWLSTPEGEAALTDVRARIALLEDRLLDAEARRVSIETRWASARELFLAAFRLNADETGEELRAAALAFDAGLVEPAAALLEVRTSADREVDTLSDELRRLRRDRGRLRDTSDALHIIAEDDGIIRDVSVLKGQFVARGAHVSQLEADVARHARGWVDHEMAAAFHPGMEVRVAVNTGTGAQILKGKISQITAGIDPELSPDFGMLVSVAFSDLDAEATRQTLPHLMPVELRAKRGWAQNISQKVSSWRATLGM
ncbi:MAG: HlyD family efflux transporter periplasmic adaptor subunit [Marinovum sp.]|nr:HlyD family efflux transporter periplasmic adaptor subunit [Marinovum sp.]